jgi:hypothetical protein
MTQTCRHGLSITEPCRECDLAAAQETVRRLGPAVDEARQLIAGSREEEVSGEQ